MPPPSSENDLKLRARRRLIGAVALTLLAVIVLPLLLEDEPPPPSSLVVRMAEVPPPVPEPLAQAEQTAAPDVADVQPQPAPFQAEPQPESLAEPQAKPAHPTSPPAPIKPPPKPAPASEPAKPAPKPQPAPTKPVASSEVFVVQLVALFDSAKAQALKERAIKAGFPAYTDALGSMTRVRVGPYMSREAAENAAAKLTANGLGKGQVLVK